MPEQKEWSEMSEKEKIQYRFKEEYIGMKSIIEDALNFSYSESSQHRNLKNRLEELESLKIDIESLHY